MWKFIDLFFEWTWGLDRLDRGLPLKSLGGWLCSKWLLFKRWWFTRLLRLLDLSSEYYPLQPITPSPKQFVAFSFQNTKCVSTFFFNSQAFFALLFCLFHFFIRIFGLTRFYRNDHFLQCMVFGYLLISFDQFFGNFFSKLVYRFMQLASSGLGNIEV